MSCRKSNRFLEYSNRHKINLKQFINFGFFKKIRQMVVNVNSDYVRKNIYIGCTERRSVMYDSSANYEETDNQCAEL